MAEIPNTTTSTCLERILYSHVSIHNRGGNSIPAMHNHKTIQNSSYDIITIIITLHTIDAEAYAF